MKINFVGKKQYGKVEYDRKIGLKPRLHTTLFMNLFEIDFFLKKPNKIRGCS
jgi:hypothetical protein